MAHYPVDLQYIFRNFRNGFPDLKGIELSNEIIKLWIGFANGKELWKDVSTEKNLHVTNKGVSCKTRGAGYDETVG